ncbi:MAG: hypothetical protein JWR80_9931 [Bradyrhizobium sp.]|nr:hypothetical protein [Bradyrhizobium sp.]
MNQKAYKVTDNTNEMSFHELFSQSTQVRIPLFQREYVWTEKQLKRLIEEIDIVVEGEDTNRFLGAIIAVRREANPAAPQPYEIVDGQQRLTTLFIFVLAAAYVAAKSGDSDYATGLINSNLAIDWWRDGTNTKLVSSYADQGQFVSAFSQVIRLGNLADTLGPRIKLPPKIGKETGKLFAQFHRIRTLLGKRLETRGEEHFKALVSTAQTKLTFVFILLKDASNATTVFEGLNDPGIPIGIGDLVRNEVFSKVADDAEAAQFVHENTWLPFRERLGEHFDDYFFPFGIVQDSSIRQADLFRGLRQLWSVADTPKEVINHLDDYVTPYLAMAAGQFSEKHPAELKEAIERLRRCNLPSSTFPFLMRLIKAVEDDQVDLKSAVSTLCALESFLVRRAIAGIEPTGLLGFFRTAWSTMEGKPSWSAFTEALKRRGTIEWPDDERVTSAVLSRKIYKVAIKNFLLAEYDRSLGADVPKDSPWIEHVLPQTLTDQWKTGNNGLPLFSVEDHEKLVDTWGNLVCLSESMNIEVSQSIYPIKKKFFSESSMFSSARALANEYDEWSPATVLARSATIGEWAILRWAR